jgi:hypothetical protein
MATVAATATRAHHASEASALATGYDRAFLLGAATMLAGVAIATVLPRGPDPEPRRAPANRAPPLAPDET